MKRRINLLQQKEVHTVDRLIYFVLHYLRYILVITQICVIGVFFYRFKMDQQIIDLKDGLDQKIEIVNVSEPIVKEAERIDKKTKTLNTLIQQQDIVAESFAYVTGIFPAKMSMNNLKISEKEIDFIGVSQDITTLKLFFARLNSDNKFKIIELKDIKRDMNGFLYHFVLQDYKLGGKS